MEQDHERCQQHWSWTGTSYILLRETISDIRVEQRPDSVTWRWNPDGRFTVKSTYLVLSDAVRSIANLDHHPLAEAHLRRPPPSAPATPERRRIHPRSLQPTRVNPDRASSNSASSPYFGRAARQSAPATSGNPARASPAVPARRRPPLELPVAAQARAGRGRARSVSRRCRRPPRGAPPSPRPPAPHHSRPDLLRPPPRRREARTRELVGGVDLRRRATGCSPPPASTLLGPLGPSAPSSGQTARLPAAGDQP
ncbi:hypothetical protein ACMD2_18093 [Ananas comosus]|uniref:Uncharacterized protein n=1 Tax=Ananas comosus TaxID=4615 RepID=A0A199UWH8_ANACO|nr:hypothetical protein ACMD2_18093 [Ananas comosus]